MYRAMAFWVDFSSENIANSKLHAGKANTLLDAHS